MNKTIARSSKLLAVFLLVMVLATLAGSAAQTVVADHTPDPASVAIAGSLQDELGCPGDWQPECAATELAFDAEDDVWQGTFNVPAGVWEYKAALNDSWGENYGAGGVLDGPNINLDLGATTDVKFYYDHKSHWVTDNANSVIATATGSFQSELGCSGDWQPWCLRSWMQDPDGDGVYEFATDQISAGNYEYKVALDEAWGTSFPGANVPFTLADGDMATFTYDSITNDVTVTVEPLIPVGPASVTIAGSLQDELGCPGDWQPDCAATHLTYDAEDDVWQGTFSLPAGSFEYKAAIDDSWDESYGANAVFGGDNILLTLAAPTDVKFYYDHKTHWVTDDVNSVVATAAGNFQSALGCSGDWQPSCLQSWLQDPDDDVVYTFSTNRIPPGTYEFKVALDEDWATSFPGSNVPFSVYGVGSIVTFSYDAGTNDVSVDVAGGDGPDPGDALLVEPSLRIPTQNDIFYFVMPDRFENGNTGNDAGGDLSGDPLVNGLLPTDKGYYHGGDLAGLSARLPYLDGLGVTAIWMTPQFTNRWVQGDGSIGGSSAGYHGYWQIDYSQIDPHFGSNAEMVDFVSDAHALGLQVFFDIVANHTGDIITYEEGTFTYRNKSDFPYRDASNVPFDDRDFAGTGTFPPLAAAISFPYTPALAPGDETVKSPAWLNDPIYYHNRGDSTFSGENSLYGDFFGLDDLFTEHHVVQDGLINIFKDMITVFDIDGFRIDTVKHVNDELWEAFGPEIDAHAAGLGKSEFFFFGEVFDSNPAFTSRFTTELPLHAVIDFGFQDKARNFASQGDPTDNLRDFYESDDYYTDSDSNAYALPTFLGNHDIGRIGSFLQQDNPGADDAELLARDELAHALMYFGRGIPVVYYGDEQGFTGDGGDKDARQDMMPSDVVDYNDDDLIGTSATTADSNFDATHPLYQILQELSGLLAAHPTLRQGAQIQRYSETGAGIFAFSRIERGEQREYLVVLNNAEVTRDATFATDSPGLTFAQIYPGGLGLTADAEGAVTVELGGLEARVYRADAARPEATDPPAIFFTTPDPGAEILGRAEVGVDLGADRYAEVTFMVSVDGGPMIAIGTDDNAPYRVYYDVGGLTPGATLDFKAIVNDLSGHLNTATRLAVVGTPEPPTVSGFDYAVIHYNRPLGDYGTPSPDFNTFWGLHLWGDGIDPSEVTDWTAPKPFEGEDEFGRFAWIKRGGTGSGVGFIIHQGDTKDTDLDRFFDANADPEIWINEEDGAVYTRQADAQGYVTIRYHREDGDYGTPSPDFNTFWGLHLWGGAIDPSEVTVWTSPKPPTGIDDYGAFWEVQIVDSSQPVNFIIHRGDNKDPGPDESFIPVELPTVWKQSGDVEIYPSRGAAEDFATIHYHRPDGDYGDNSSPDYNDFWGMHVWSGALSPTVWPDPLRWSELDVFGPVFQVGLVDGAPELAYIIHRGDAKDPGPDQFLSFDPWGYEVWQLSGADPEKPYVLPIIGEGAAPGDINTQQAYWVTEDTIAWAAGGDPSADYRLYYAPTGGMTLGAVDIEDGSYLDLNQGAPFPDGIDGFLHLAGMPTLNISSADLGLVPEILKGQIAVQVTKDGGRLDATGLQIPGVLDDLYIYDGELGVSWDGGVPTMRVWAPTAKSVTFHLFDNSDPATTSTATPMTFDPTTGVWSTSGNSNWKGQYYLYEVEVYVHSTGQVEQNEVTDPYSLSLAMNSTRSQIVDLSDGALKPAGWDEVQKPALAAPEDISVYEIHVRDFSVNDNTVPEALKGTYKAFTLEDKDGTNHLKMLQEAGLTHLHLLPVFDIATINENKAEWQEPDWSMLETYPPDSDQQQAAVTATEDLDGFNWGYDPFHYTTPEGSYATDPDGSTRIVEFREMVQSLNEDTGLRVVMDVVYNHTNAAGQDEKSVLDRIVPGYYHRLNDQGDVETSTCCQNTATEHNMMEKLMIDSLVVWAEEYKVDAFRFDLMGHHSLANMLNVQAALAEVDPDIYIYGEGWNFGEVADDARFVQATQFNLGGSGIGSFSDRLRDAVRGGSPFDGGTDLIKRQGFANGLYYDPNAENSGSPDELNTLLLLTDQIRVGMVGNLADYQFMDRNGDLVTGKDVDYNGQPAGYTQDPQEDITYISKHDNQTLYDNNTYKIPLTVGMEDRVRVQNVGLSTVLLGQGVPFMHAGSDLLRSKSFDRDSFNSGDWFNKLDFSYQENNYGVGLPVAGKNQDNWYLMGPLLANPGLNPDADNIWQAADLFQELLAVRDSSPLFRLQTEGEVQERVMFHNTGSTQLPGLIVMSVDDSETAEDLDSHYESIIVLVNANDEAQMFGSAALAELDLDLHLVQVNSVDDRVKMSSFDSASGTFVVPGRTTAVFVSYEAPDDLIGDLKDQIQDLVDQGVLNKGQGNALTKKLDRVLKELAKDRPEKAIKAMTPFINLVNAFAKSGVLPQEMASQLLMEAEIIIAAIEAQN